MTTRRAKTWYPHPRIGDDVGEIESDVYHVLCRGTSFRDDDFTGRLPVDPWKPGEVVIRHSKLEKRCRLSKQQVRVALNRLIERGAVVKVASEGKYGNRYFLPHQAKLIPAFLKIDEETERKTEANTDKFAEQESNRKATGKQQEKNRKRTPKIAGRAGAEGRSRTGKEQEKNRKATGKEQESNYSTKQITNINDQRTNNIIIHVKYVLQNSKLFKKTWSKVDDAVLQSWLAEGKDIIQIVAAIRLGLLRAYEREVKVIKTLKYFRNIVENDVDDYGYVSHLLDVREHSDIAKAERELGIVELSKSNELILEACDEYFVKVTREMAGRSL